MYKKFKTCIKCLPLIILLATISSCDNNKQDKTPKKETSGYNFSIPKEWQTERINFPIDFAPQISYTGVEDLRFAPGWEFTTSEEHWSYAFYYRFDFFLYGLQKFIGNGCFIP